MSYKLGVLLSKNLNVILIHHYILCMNMDVKEVHNELCVPCRSVGNKNQKIRELIDIVS